MNRGDYVTVTVFGQRHPAQVLDTYTELGNVRVRLLEPVVDEEVGRVSVLYRDRADVHELHVRTVEPATVVMTRLDAVVERLDVALQFESVDEAVLAQGYHAVEFALRGAPRFRGDEYQLDVTPDDALALVRALLPYIHAARHQPLPECSDNALDDEELDR